MLKWILYILLSFIAITATLSGLLMVCYPDGSALNLFLELLKETAFKDFRIPGIILVTAVGLANLVAVFVNIRGLPSQYNWAMVAGIMISGWIIAQVILINTVSWLHGLYLILGILIVLLAYQLKGKWVL